MELSSLMDRNSFMILSWTMVQIDAARHRHDARKKIKETGLKAWCEEEELHLISGRRGAKATRPLDGGVGFKREAGESLAPFLKTSHRSYKSA